MEILEVSINSISGEQIKQLVASGKLIIGVVIDDNHPNNEIKKLEGFKGVIKKPEPELRYKSVSKRPYVMRKKRKSYKTELRCNLIEDYILEQGKPIRLDALAKRFNIPVGGSYNKVTNRLRKSKKVVMSRVGLGGGYVVAPSSISFQEDKHQFMKRRKPSKYNLFVKGRAATLVKQGHTPPDAIRICAAEWGQQQTGITKKPEFPDFPSVKVDKKIIESILRECIFNNRPVNFTGVAYALGLVTYDNFKEFCREVMYAKVKQIKEFFNVAGAKKTFIFKDRMLWWG